jgi:hypothetical protein
VFSRCEACAKSGGSGCAEHPLVTCPVCEAKYVDDEDWSGPAHGQRECTHNLLREIERLRAGIRKHRDASGHDLCWYAPELWDLLPDKKEPQPAVPPRAEFLARCAEYRDSLPEGPIPPAAVLAKLRAQAEDKKNITTIIDAAKCLRRSDFVDPASNRVDDFFFALENALGKLGHR